MPTFAALKRLGVEGLRLLCLGVAELFGLWGSTETLKHKPQPRNSRVGCTMGGRCAALRTSTGNPDSHVGVESFGPQAFGA